MEKKCLISKGNVNKYIFFALIAGLSKFFVTLMVYIFPNYAAYNKHPLIIGFNAGLGMSLSIIPLIILKSKSHRERKNKNLKVIQVLSNETKSISSRSDSNYLEKYNKKKLKVQKFLILFACAFLDFSNKFLTFFFNKLVIHNIWIFI